MQWKVALAIPAKFALVHGSTQTSLYRTCEVKCRMASRGRIRWSPTNVAPRRPPKAEPVKELELYDFNAHGPADVRTPDWALEW